MEAVADTLELLRRASLVAATIEDALAGTDLTVDRWRALTCIEANPGCSMSDVIDALVIPSTSATRIVDSLVEIGAIFRTISPHDRRRTTLRLSSDGQALLRDVEPTIAAAIAVKPQHVSPL
ncbi:MarR family transcriptional regulator [Mycolicibacterium sp. P9-64]|uniref:MarR family winged helix-turn-helix transcriptional regulator n=1 Tax=Mycolicibacterium sp. P9-64 TaxID=2024612 RepID=UPI0011ED5465|nr:MarR family transcriptional regulator [Mycolicibacterium sp. P9-64]KAA0082619.1 MarR family transcriptional regulator [Mycolicibacterium sp. P9-64]